MSGPQQQRLHQYLIDTRPERVDRAQAEWAMAADALTRVAYQLQRHSLPGERPGKIGDLTGKAMAREFQRSAEAMTAKADELARGSAALRNASDAITDAQTTRDELVGSDAGPRPEPLAFTGPMTPQDIRADADRNAEIAAWDADQERRERRAREAADRMDTTFTDSSAALRKIHRETPPQDGSGRGPGGDSSAPGGRIPTGPTSPSPGGPGPGHPAGPGGGDTSGTPHGPGHATDEPIHGGDGPPAGPAATTLGIPQGPGAAEAPPVLAGPTGGTAPVSGGSSVSSAGAGAALGGLALGGGMIAAGSGSPGVRAVATPAAGTQNARPIGATSSRGAAPTLGRSASAIAPGQQTPGSRASTGGRPGARTRAAFGKPASAAPAGERRVATPGHAASSKKGSGTGGASRGRDGRKDRTLPAVYLEEWELRDDDAAPGVLD